MGEFLTQKIIMRAAARNVKVFAEAMTANKDLVGEQHVALAQSEWAESLPMQKRVRLWL